MALLVSGGEKVIKSLAGKDCSEVFRTFHNPKLNRLLLPAFRIGKTFELKDTDEIERSAITKDFESLRKTLEEEGAFKPDCKSTFHNGFYTQCIIFFISSTSCRFSKDPPNFLYLP